MGLGLGVLRLAPEVFWAMSVPEFAAAAEAITGAGGGTEPMGRARLDKLMTDYPDEARPDD